MLQQRIKEKRTLIKIAVQTTSYAAGAGASTSWTPLVVYVGKDENTNDVTTECFYCEWLNSYGQNAIQQQADGIVRPARVRMPYVSAVYDALINKAARIYKNGIIDDAHCYQLSSSPDNYIERNKMIEFNVKKVEVK